MKTGIGIIGCGQISHFHYEGWEAAGAEIVHVCDMNLDAARKVAARYQCAATTDHRVVINDPRVSVISVCTSAAAHREICLAAIAAGKGVVCEKTLSDNPADSFEIARAASGKGVFFATAYMKRFFPAMREAKAMLDEMGEIISIHARSWQPWDLWNQPVSGSLAEHPSSLRRNYGGGVLVCAGSHILDLLHWIAGRPRQVCGRMHVRKEMDVDIQTSAMLWPERGGVIHLDLCWHPLASAGYERNGWDERIEINTVKGRLTIYTVLWNKPENNGMLLVHEDAVSGKVTEHRFRPVNPFHEEMAELLRRFQSGEPGYPSAWDGYVVDEIIARITASATENRIVPMEWKDR